MQTEPISKITNEKKDKALVCFFLGAIKSLVLVEKVAKPVLLKFLLFLPALLYFQTFLRPCEYVL